MIHRNRGLHHAAEGDYLENVASHVSKGNAIVEIGSYIGASTLRLAEGAQAGNGARVTCIDPWPEPFPGDTSDHAKRQREALEKFEAAMDENHWPVTALRAYSGDVLPMWIQPIGLLFIDGNHDYAEVVKDLEWRKHITPHGIIAMHDYLDDTGKRTDVADAVSHVLKQPGEWQTLEIVNTMWIGGRR